MKAKTNKLSNSKSRSKQDSSRMRLHRCHAVVIGAGAIGRAVAILLASLGVRHMSLYDPAIVTRKHLAQGFLDYDLGTAKVDAVANIAHQHNPRMELLTFRSGLRHQHMKEWKPDLQNAVFLCGVTKGTGKSILNQVMRSAHFICEARLGTAEIRLSSRLELTTESSINELATNKPNRSTTDLVMANITACIMVYQFMRW